MEFGIRPRPTANGGADLMTRVFGREMIEPSPARLQTAATAEHEVFFAHEFLLEGLETTEAILVSIGMTRLRALGFEVPFVYAQPEHRLYAHLSRTEGLNAHSAYNALVRRLVSFERAMEMRRSSRT